MSKKLITDYVVSDWHLGNSWQSDTTRQYERKLLTFLESINNYSQIWLLGDTFELDQLSMASDIDMLIESNNNILAELKKRLVHMLPGDHDREIANWWGIAFWQTEPQTMFIERREKKIMLFHGAWDDFNVNAQLKVLEKLKSSSMENADHHDWLRAYSYAGAYTAIDHQCDTVIKGHTHVSSIETAIAGITVMDTGSPLQSNGTIPYGVIFDDGSVELKHSNTDGSV